MQNKVESRPNFQVGCVHTRPEAVHVDVAMDTDFWDEQLLLKPSTNVCSAPSSWLYLKQYQGYSLIQVLTILAPILTVHCLLMNSLHIWKAFHEAMHFWKVRKTMSYFPVSRFWGGFVASTKWKLAYESTTVIDCKAMSKHRAKEW